MRKFHLSIFWKFTIGIILIVGIIGTINIILIQKSIISSLQSESEKRGKYIALNIANQAVEPLIYEDNIALQKLVDNTRAIDSSVIYTIIEIGNGNNKFIHDLKINLPSELINANKLKNNVDIQIQLITPKNLSRRTIRDIAVPILNRDLGSVRIGILEDTIVENAQNALRILLIMVGLFVIIGIMSAFIFSRVITKPIKKISIIADNLDFESLKTQNTGITGLELIQTHKLPFHVSDEMDNLSEKFFSMINRLSEAYAEIETTHIQLIQSEKLASIGTLAAGIAHEINNPNSGIQYCLRILKKENLYNVKYSEYLEMMDEATIKIEKVVKGLLDYSRPQLVDFECISLNEIINKAISLIKYRADKSSITIKYDIMLNPVEVYGSYHFLQQVIINLLINAIDAIEEKKGTDINFIGQIDIMVLKKTENTTIKIRDNGIGIQSENINKVFDPFYTSKEVGKGTGLGLSVSNKIITQHKGQINVVSNYGDGTTFEITLPNNQR